MRTVVREARPMRLVNLTDRQVQYLNDEDHRFFVLCPGRRARKTLLSTRKLIYGPRGAAQNPQTRYFCGAPTRQQAKDIFWERIKFDTRAIWLRDPHESELYVELLNGSRIYVKGLERPQRIEGTPWDGCIITEFAELRDEAWGQHVYPVLSDTGGWAIMDSVPEGRNHFYEHALYACGGIIPEGIPKIGVRGENPDDPPWVYYHWFSSDVLPPEEIKQARRNLDERTYRQEYEGQFVGYAGLAYYAFGEHNLDSLLERIPKESVHVGMDFNINPMTASLCHIRSDDIFQWGEIYLSNSNTFEIRDRLLELAQSWELNIPDVIIYPDSTGAHENSNATRSDIAILRQAGFTVRARTHNPRVVDRVNAVNSKIKVHNGQTHYKINPVNCPKTMEDFNKVERLDDGRLNKDQEKQGLKHMSDNIGYLTHYLFPIRKSVASSAPA